VGQRLGSAPELLHSYACERSYGQVWTVVDGMIARVEFFPTRAAALEAAGLSE
jgi:ketosteroid isomerase-like protein